MKKIFLLTIAFILTLNCVLGQTALPNKVSSFIKAHGLLPLNQVDTITKDLPKNFTTKSGWHVDYYARIIQEGATQLNVYSLIYNDSIFHSPWYPHNPKNIKYKPLTFAGETSEFLYLSIHNPEISDTLYTISKRQDNKWLQAPVQNPDYSNKAEKLSGNYFFIANSTNGRFCSIGKQSKRMLKLRTGSVFDVYHISPTDTMLFEQGQWLVNADTLILNYKKSITPNNRKKNCNVKSDGNKECFDYEVYLIKKQRLYWANYGKATKEEFAVWYERKK